MSEIEKLIQKRIGLTGWASEGDLAGMDKQIASRLATLERVEKALREYVKWHGPAHETECPCDDTCDCQFKWLNDLVNAALEDKTK